MVWNGRITTWWGPQLPQSAMEENRLSVMTGWVLDFSDSTFRGIKIAKSISLILWMVHTAKILTKCRCKWVTVSHDFRVNCLTLLPCAIKTALLGSKSKSNIFSIMQIVQRSKLGKMSWYDLVCIEICDASPDRRWQFLSLWERSFVLLCIVYDFNGVHSWQSRCSVKLLALVVGLVLVMVFLPETGYVPAARRLVEWLDDVSARLFIASCIFLHSLCASAADYMGQRLTKV